MDRKDYLKSRISESLKGPIEESYKKKYETAPEGVKAVADHMAMLKKHIKLLSIMKKRQH